jgi:hypothetical protein
MLVYFMDIWSILRPFYIFYAHLIYFMPIVIFYGNLVYFPRFGILYQEKSGNPASRDRCYDFWNIFAKKVDAKNGVFCIKYLKFFAKISS